MAQQRLKTVFMLTAFWCAAGVAGAADISLQEAIEKSAAVMVEKLPAKTRVAVVAMEAESENLAEFIMDEVTGILGDSGIEVADRNNLDYILKELHFQASGLTDDKTAAQVGKQLGAKYVITGQLVHLGASYRYRLTAINTESAVQEANSRLTVKDDGAFKKMLAALNKNKQVTREAKSAVTEKTMPQTAGTFLDRGMLFASRGDYDLAIEDFTEAIKLDPNNVTAYKFRGLSYFYKKDYDRAIAEYNQAIKLDPNNAEAYGLRGEAYFCKKDYDRAIADYTQAIKLAPNLKDIYTTRSNAYIEKGDYDRAIADSNQAIKLDPNSKEAYASRGLAFYSKGDYDKAITDYSQAIKLDPNYALA